MQHMSLYVNTIELIKFKISFKLFTLCMVEIKYCYHFKSIQMQYFC
jgi:hypothetical protein